MTIQLTEHSLRSLKKALKRNKREDNYESEFPSVNDATLNENTIITQQKVENPAIPWLHCIYLLLPSYAYNVRQNFTLG